MSTSLDTIEMETISATVKRGWLFDKRIVIYQTSNSTNETVDQWVMIVTQTVTNWAKDRPYLEIQDMRNLSITAYSRDRAMELQKWLAEYSGYSAILVSNNLLGRGISFAVNHIFPKMGHKLQRKVFTNWDQAVEWLKPFAQNP